MSYILDALKKSDQERQSRQGPTIQTIQRPVNGGANPLRWVVVTLVIAVLVGAVVALSVWAYRTSKADLQAVAEQPASAPAVTVPVQAPTATKGAQPVGAEPAAGDYPTVAFSALPDNLRNEIPALTFSFHVYSDVPSSRTIIINNRRVREGDSVLQHLQLEEITREGVVLSWKGRRFYINVVENW